MNINLELNKVDKAIENKLIQFNKELGQYNKNCLMNELQRLWDRKKTLQKIAKQLKTGLDKCRYIWYT